jgi:hypothetical protein
MRYVILAVFFYSLYLFLRFLINVFFKQKIETRQRRPLFGRKSKIDIDKIEDAEYEEIKEKNNAE